MVTYYVYLLVGMTNGRDKKANKGNIIQHNTRRGLKSRSTVLRKQGTLPESEGPHTGSWRKVSTVQM